MLQGLKYSAVQRFMPISTLFTTEYGSIRDCLFIASLKNVKIRCKHTLAITKSFPIHLANFA